MSTVDGVTSAFALELPGTEDGAFSFTGEATATVNGVETRFPITGRGSFSAPTVTMVLVVTVAPEITTTTNLTGTASDSGDSITLQDGDGFPLTLTRQ